MSSPWKTATCTPLRSPRVGKTVPRRRAKRGTEPDLELTALKAYYKELEIVDAAFMKRLRIACEEDANLNAIGIFCSLAGIMSMSLDDMLQGIKPTIMESF